MRAGTLVGHPRRSQIMLKTARASILLTRVGGGTVERGEGGGGLSVLYLALHHRAVHLGPVAFSLRRPFARKGTVGFTVGSPRLRLPRITFLCLAPRGFHLNVLGCGFAISNFTRALVVICLACRGPAC